jgi:hypothetical protein
MAGHLRQDRTQEIWVKQRRRAELELAHHGALALAVHGPDPRLQSSELELTHVRTAQANATAAGRRSCPLLDSPTAARTEFRRGRRRTVHAAREPSWSHGRHRRRPAIEAALAGAEVAVTSPDAVAEHRARAVSAPRRRPLRWSRAWPESSR